MIYRRIDPQELVTLIVLGYSPEKNKQITRRGRRKSFGDGPDTPSDIGDLFLLLLFLLDDVNIDTDARHRYAHLHVTRDARTTGLFPWLLTFFRIVP